ncbi:MAG: DUF5329 family protein [Thermodesulfobacteriota bacterium]
MKRVVLITLMLLVFSSAAASGSESPEAEKIRYLISSVEILPGATFIRNGAEHSPREAAEHLRMKLDKAGRRVRTAEDFIRLCASRSFLSRKPYHLKFGNGKVVATEKFLREKLAAFALKNERPKDTP